MILDDGNNIYSIFYSSHIFKKCIFKKLVELPFNSTFDLTFSCSTGDEWNLVYNKNSSNCILIIIIIKKGVNARLGESD